MNSSLDFDITVDIRFHLGNQQLKRMIAYLNVRN